MAAAALLLTAAASAGDRLVSLPDQRKIHLVCSGRGSPTVVFESGYGADAGAWYKVRPLLDPKMRVCSYDRAGYGRSSPGPLPRDGLSIARDLDAALKAGREGGPLILVGHSAGALYVRLLAARRADQVIGLVLVDPSVEFQVQRTEQVLGRGAGSIAPIRDSAAKCLQAVQARGRGVTDQALAGCLPGADQPAARALALRPDYWRTQISEIETLFGKTSEQVAARARTVRDIPAIVLTATPTDGPTADRNDSLHRRQHAELAAAFAGGRQRLVKSSHLMMLDRPEMVAAAVQELARAPGPGKEKARNP
jgi:pimeloyl-ACP methyl ester carboxylesterase